MKANKKKRLAQQRIIQQKLDRLSSFNEPVPPSGWLKAIRGSLSLSIRQLADRLGVAHGSIDRLEKREPNKRVTLESLDKAASAMDCKLIYAIVPQESGVTLEEIIERRAKAAAAKILKSVGHTMRLEAQGTSDKEIRAEIDRVARELIESRDSIIWETEKVSPVKKRNT